MPIERVAGLTGTVGIKAPCRVATPVEVILYGIQQIDEVVLAAGDRILVKDQTDASQNGIWVVSTGAWTRAPDLNGSRDAVRGTLVYVVDGDANAEMMFRLESASDTFTIGTTAITFEAISPVSSDAGAEAAEESAAEALASALAAAASATASAASAAAAANSAILAANRAAGISAVPVGATVFWLSGTPPEGWLECDGSLVSRTEYPDLHAFCNGNFGPNDGVTNFALPDLRGRFLRGWDHGIGIDPGRGLGTAQASAVGLHTHPASVSVTGSTDSAGAHSHTLTPPVTELLWNNYPGSALIQSNTSGTNSYNFYSVIDAGISTAGAHSHAVAISGTVTVDANLGGGLETRPINIAGMWIIKAIGPSSILGIAWASQAVGPITGTGYGGVKATGSGSATLATITQTANALVTGP